MKILVPIITKPQKEDLDEIYSSVIKGKNPVHDPSIIFDMSDDEEKIQIINDKG